MRYVELEDKRLPCLTICPWAAYKKEGFHYSNEDFLKNTFNRFGQEAYENIPPSENIDLQVALVISGFDYSMNCV